MKLVTILGTRPEIIRLSRVIPKLDKFCQQTVIHTGQNYDFKLDGIFFEQLGLRKADHVLGARGTVGQQLATILSGCESIFEQLRPDRFLVLGDTNSSLAAIIAKRMAIPVFHMEAGNRCYDDRVPEEVNRRIIDHSSDILLPYTERSRQNLLREGVAGERIVVTGNPIFEVLAHYGREIDESAIFNELGVEPGKYFLATLHRAENVDVPSRLQSAIQGLQQVAVQYGIPMILSTHPRTRTRLQNVDLAAIHPLFRFCEPFGFFDFVALEKKARCVFSDSGTVQEECAIFGVANVTLRDTTERPETIECGSNILSGVNAETIVRCARLAIEGEGKWNPPPEYLVPSVSESVARVILGHVTF